MKLADPRLWITLLSLAVVAAMVFLDFDRTSPGPLAAVHAAVPELTGPESCALCHGGWADGADGMTAACLACHGAIEQQLAFGRGLHGDLEDAGRCARCHPDHLGAELELAGARAFALAGRERDTFDHGHVAFELEGRHAELACSECHAHADASPLAAGTQRFLGLEQRCAACHADPHAGAFAAGCATCHGQAQPFASLASFEHGDAFPLVGAHARSACVDCHVPGGAFAIEVVGGPEPRPPARGCADCHASPHREPFLAAFAQLTTAALETGCATCHDVAEDAFVGTSADLALTRSPELHAATGFELASPHDDAECAQCHAASDSFEQRFPGRAPQACEVCHADPHAGQFERGCAACHGQQPSFAPTNFDTALHATTALPLEGAHADLDCARCHLPSVAGEPVRFAGTPSSCEACHADAHAGAFELAAGAAAGCAECHRATAFADVEEFDHARWTAFELVGAHARADCAACHARTTEADEFGRRFGRARAAFGEALPACAACHADPHAGAFAAAGDCATCHGPEQFEPALAGAFDHAVHAGFALDGAHAPLDCAACHGAGEDRRLGRVADHYPGPAERCETCHADPHDAAFDSADRPSVVEGRVGCARCHNTKSFATFETDETGSDAQFDHGLWTGYALGGAHARARCDACHARMLDAEPGGRSLAPAPGRECSACHADPHRGQLAVVGRNQCSRCHTSQSSFAELAFQHDRDSRFALDEAHAALDCAACHVPWPLPDGTEVVRYKPLGTRCIDCHDHGGDHGGER